LLNIVIFKIEPITPYKNIKIGLYK